MSSSDTIVANLTDAYCLDLFPELKRRWPSKELLEASDVGSYIFHEDFFLKWMCSEERSSSEMKRICEYLEYLANSPNPHLNDLLEIGILRGVISNHAKRISAFFGPSTRTIFKEAIQETKSNINEWPCA